MTERFKLNELQDSYKPNHSVILRFYDPFLEMIFDLINSIPQFLSAVKCASLTRSTALAISLASVFPKILFNSCAIVISVIPLYFLYLCNNDFQLQYFLAFTSLFFIFSNLVLIQSIRLDRQETVCWDPGFSFFHQYIYFFFPLHWLAHCSCNWMLQKSKVLFSGVTLYLRSVLEIHSLRNKYASVNISLQLCLPNSLSQLEFLNRWLIVLLFLGDSQWR